MGIDIVINVWNMRPPGVLFMVHPLCYTYSKGGVMDIYLESFGLPVEKEEKLLIKRMKHNGGYVDNMYPCGLFDEKQLYEIHFKKITVFYGGNGSGKSTLLNLIAEKLGLNRIAPYNSGEMFADYVNECGYTTGYDDEGFLHRIPDGSRIITSDDIFDYMLAVRTNNDEISDSKEEAADEWVNLKFGDTIKMRGMDDFEAVRTQLLARKKNVTRRQFIRRTAGEEVRLNSNGETALQYFEQRLHNDTLYCLDEPENSMSPVMQLELVRMLEDLVRYCGCQLVIATHSPFLLALEGARIYDLDSRPAGVKNWWQLENVRVWYDFFRKHQYLFEE